MTYEELAARIAAMTPEQRLCPAAIADLDIGESFEIKDVVSHEDFNGVEILNQMIMLPHQCYRGVD